jgi:putative membrane protein (TIGR04086 family)
MDAKLLKNAVISVGIAYLAAAGLLLILGTSAYNLEDPDKYLTFFAITALALSAAACGFAASRLNGDAAFACGLTAGLIFAVLLFIVSSILPGEGFGLPINAATALCTAGISSFTAHVSRPRSPSVTQLRRKARRARTGR